MTQPSTVRHSRHFQGLLVGRWRQIAHVEFAFHPNVTILTGSNGSGKSTILNVLAQHFQWTTQFASIAQRDQYTGRQQYLTEWRSGGTPSEQQHDNSDQDYFNRHNAIGPYGSEVSVIGQLSYSDGHVVEIGVPKLQKATYAIVPKTGWQGVDGVYIPAFRSPTMYTDLKTIPAQFSAANTILDSYTDISKKRFQPDTYIAPNDHAFRTMKEALVAAAVYGFETLAVEANPDAAAAWLGFQDALRALLPKEFGFEALVARAPEIIVKTTSGDEFTIDSVSGGISAVMEITWQVFLCTWGRESAVVLLDEPENHLHPSLQRTFLSGLVRAFPKVQFVVASHSPFIVTSVRDSYVYALRFSPDGLVRSELLDLAEKSGGSDQVLREVLGVETSRPEWAVREYDEIITEFTKLPVEEMDLLNLRDRLIKAGLASAVPTAVQDVTLATREPWSGPNL